MDDRPACYGISPRREDRIFSSNEAVAMRISGHKSRSIFDRYDITDERDIKIAGQKLALYLEEKGKVVTEVVTGPKNAETGINVKPQ